MALQTSGAIYFSQLKSVYGGGNPAYISNYYRNGPYVPSTKSVVVRDPTSGETYTAGSTYWRVIPGTDQSSVVIGGAILWTTVGQGTAYSYNGSNYYRGTFVSTLYGIYYYKFYMTYSSSISVNQNVPTSGAIWFSQFYGGDK